MKNKKNTKTKKSAPNKSTAKSAGTYVDGFVLTIPKKSLSAYKKLVKIAKKVWLDHGALQYAEAIGDDLNVKMGISFPTLVKAGQNAKESDLVVFSWIVYKSKSHRNQVNAKVMKDKRISCDPSKMPFDCNKMSYGGFKIIS